MVTKDIVREALSFITPNLPRDEWVKIGMAIKSEYPNSFDLFNDWSKGGDSYKERDAHATWASISQGGGVTIASLIHQAQNCGFSFQQSKPLLGIKKTLEPREFNLTEQEITQTACNAQKVWSMAAPARSDHPYLIKKKIPSIGIGETTADNLYLPSRMKRGRRFLVVPMHDIFGKIWCIEFISEDGEKAFIRGKQRRGVFYRVGLHSNSFAIVEGVATGISYYQATNQTVYCAFTAYSLNNVGLALRTACPYADIKFVADDDWSNQTNVGVTKALEAASMINAKVYVPNFSGYERATKHTDFNDLYVLGGGYGAN